MRGSVHPTQYPVCGSGQHWMSRRKNWASTKWLTPINPTLLHNYVGQSILPLVWISLWLFLLLLFFFVCFVVTSKSKGDIDHDCSQSGKEASLKLELKTSETDHFHSLHDILWQISCCQQMSFLFTVSFPFALCCCCCYQHRATRATASSYKSQWEIKSGALTETEGREKMWGSGIIKGEYLGRMNEETQCREVLERNGYAQMRKVRMSMM